MKDVVEAAGSSLRKFPFRLVKRFELARLWFFGHPRQYNPTVLARHFKLVAVVQIDFRENFPGERDSQFTAAHRGLGHMILLVSSGVAILFRLLRRNPSRESLPKPIDVMASKWSLFLDKLRQHMLK